MLTALFKYVYKFAFFIALSISHHYASQSTTTLLKTKLFYCPVQMIKSKVGSIKSGWRSVFMIFTASADDELESIVESAFENVEQGNNFLTVFFMTLMFFLIFTTLVYLILENLQ